jgi:hypothetical protein
MARGWDLPASEDAGHAKRSIRRSRISMTSLRRRFVFRSVALGGEVVDV